MNVDFRSILFQNCLLTVWNWLFEYCGYTWMTYVGMVSSQISWVFCKSGWMWFSSLLKYRHYFYDIHIYPDLDSNFQRLYWFILLSGMSLSIMRAYSYRPIDILLFQSFKSIFVCIDASIEMVLLRFSFTVTRLMGYDDILLL